MYLKYYRYAAVYYAMLCMDTIITLEQAILFLLLTWTQSKKRGMRTLKKKRKS